MSWDIAIMKFTRPCASPDDIPDDEPCLCLENGWQGIDCGTGGFVERSL
jgi:hypothetical protein